MNTLERALIEKAGYDNGWENVVGSVPERVELASALHRAVARVEPCASARWRITLPAGTLSAELAKCLPSRHLYGNQFTANNDLELGRLLREAARLARTLPDLPEAVFADEVARQLSAIGIQNTEVERMVRQRVGQDVFRRSLMDYWGGACAVTGIALPEILRASHAIPWAECTSDADRLNVFNGLLLTANLDALFDRHLLSFDDQGQALFHPTLTPALRHQLKLPDTLHLRWLSPHHLPFLQAHRERMIG